MCTYAETNIIYPSMNRSDNDMYAHLNNSVYYYLIDSIVNTYLITQCGLDPFSAARSYASSYDPSFGTAPTKPSQIGLVVSSYCDYFSPVSFPDVLELGLQVVRLGSSSATYEVGIFRKDEDDVKAVGGFTHAFVEREGTRRVGWGRGAGMDENIREGLERLVVPSYRPKAKL